MDLTVSRFACTQCGKCCNRSPEVELSEATSLADTFVFRLMFRLHWLPQKLGDYLSLSCPEDDASAIYYEKKRLLSAFAARKYTARLSRNGKPLTERGRGPRQAARQSEQQAGESDGTKDGH